MRLNAQSAKRTLAIMTLALASCRGPIRALTPTPEIIPIRLTTTSSTAPLLQSLALNYQPENTLVSIVNQTDTVYTAQYLSSSPNTPEPNHPQYVLTAYYPSQSQAWAAPLGQDGLAIIAHPSLRLDYLTALDLRNIFSGLTYQWSEITQSSSQQIVVVGREETSASRQVFEEIVLGQRSITPAARLATSSQAMLDIVASTPGAIGFISAALVTQNVQVIKIATDHNSPALMPSLENIYNETYPLRMPLLIVGPRPPTPGDGYYEFIAWAQSDGQKIIADHYAPLPISD